MLDFVLLAIGIVGFGLAGYWDLRYTEFPDWLPYSMIVLALVVRGVFAFVGNDWWILGNSVFIGVIFLSLGLLLYFSKQWGDGDAWLLGALGFLFPGQIGLGAKTFLPFPLTLLFNFLLVSLAYLIIYSIMLGIRNRSVNRKYIEHLRKEKHKFIGFSVFFFAVSWGFALVMYFWFSLEISNLMQMVMLPFLLTFILFFSYYAKMVEKNLFKRRINTSELKEGDVILEGKWRGLTKKEVTEIRRAKKYVWVKEGVRFAPVFVVTMLISLFYGDFLFLFI
ncbi:MAG: prepilin peptidase [Candidatus Aenigmatarchaeota archaeon]|nr:MAG: prepilin peptidase [Candidatus Aenigmarchaeota archaeon]